MKNFFILILMGLCTISYSYDVLENVKRYLPESPKIIDAGAYQGGESISFIKIWPKATVYSFEPLPHNYDALKANTREYANINIYSYALSDKTGEAIFHVSTHENPNKIGDQSSSLLQPKGHLVQWRDILFKKDITVRTITIDEWAKQEGITAIDFLWLDLQGMEYQVLKASPEILKTVKAIYTEINFSELYEGCLLYPAFKKWFENNGFVEVYKHATWGTFGDALFVRKELV